VRSTNPIAPRAPEPTKATQMNGIETKISQQAITIIINNNNIAKR
jgi:hypothetical protein